MYTLIITYDPRQQHNSYNDEIHADTNYRFTYVPNLSPLCYLTTACRAVASKIEVVRPRYE